MRIFLAIVLPFMVFFTIGRPFSGIFCLLLQLTVLCWPIAVIWAVYCTAQYHADKRIEKLEKAILNSNRR